MEQNTLVKEICPEEVKAIDPFEISYIAMKDGSIILVTEKNNENNYNLIDHKEMNIYQIKERNEENSPKRRNYRPYQDNDSDYNVYHSNNNKIIIQENTNKLNNNFNNIENNSFYSYDDIKTNYNLNNNIHKNVNINNNFKVDYIYRNNKIGETNKIIENNLNDNKCSKINYIKNVDKEDYNYPYIIEKKKYFIRKKIIEEEPSIKQSKTFSYKIPSKDNNIYIIRNANQNNNKNKNILISYSNKISNENENNNYNIIRNNYPKTPEIKYRYKNMNTYYCTCKRNNYLKSNRNLSEDIMLNSRRNSNNQIHNSYYKVKKNDINGYYNNKINQYKNQNHSFIGNSSNNLIIQALRPIYLRAKTPEYSLKNYGHCYGNNKKVNNHLKMNKLRVSLRSDNHRFYERKEIRKRKKISIRELNNNPKSNYFKLTNLNGKNVHAFED